MVKLCTCSIAESLEARWRWYLEDRKLALSKLPWWIARRLHRGRDLVRRGLGPLWRGITPTQSFQVRRGHDGEFLERCLEARTLSSLARAVFWFEMSNFRASNTTYSACKKDHICLSMCKWREKTVRSIWPQILIPSQRAYLSWDAFRCIFIVMTQTNTFKNLTKYPYIKNLPLDVGDIDGK